MNVLQTNFWSLSISEIFKSFNTKREGLATEVALKRLKLYGPNAIGSQGSSTSLSILFAQFKSPIVIIFIFSAVLSFFLQDSNDSIIILIIVFVSGMLGFFQERGATNAVKELLDLVQTKSKVIRDEKMIEIPSRDVVPGDIVI